MYTQRLRSSAATAAVHTPLPRRGLKSHQEDRFRALPRKALSQRRSAHKAMADRDDAMDVGAIEDDALNDDDEQDENGDEVEEGYKMV